MTGTSVFPVGSMFTFPVSGVVNYPTHNDVTFFLYALSFITPSVETSYVSRC